jgi:hypothetical protein
MATTTNYGWATPDNTDLVKDGALAIRTLGSSVDTTTKALNPSTTLGDIEYRSATANTNTRLPIGSTGNVLTVTGGVPVWAAPAAGAQDLTLVKSQTIGTSVTSITVNDAFSATYDAYKIYVSGGSGAGQAIIELQLGASTSTYYQAIAGVNYSSGTVTGRTVNNGSSWLRSGVVNGSNGIVLDATIVNPFLAKYTYAGFNFPYTDEGSWATGYHATATSYSSFVLTSGSALTGGEIRVYGYKK